MDSNNKSVKPIVLWFQKEIFPWKISDGIVRVGLFHFVFLFFFLLIANFSNFSSPWQTFLITFHPSSWIYQLILLGSLFAHCTLVSKNLSLEPYLPKHRVSTISELMSPNLAGNLAISVLLGGFYVRSLVGLTGGALNSFTMICKDKDEIPKCLNVRHFVIVTMGMFTGLVFWIRMIFQNRNLLFFSPINENGAIQFRSKIFGLLKKGFLDALSLQKFYILVFIVIGYPMTSSIISMMRLEHQISILQVLKALLYSIPFNGFFLFILNCSTEILQIILTKPLNLEVEGDFGLLEALGQNDNPMLKYLAFRDLLELSKNSKAKRNVLFRLSQPGGHPRAWNSMSESTLQVINQFISDLNSSAQTQASISNFKPKDQQQQNYTNLRRRNVIFPEQPPTSNATTTKSCDFEKLRKNKNWLSLFEMIWKNLQKNSLFSPFPDFFLRSVFAKSQIVIWSVEALSQLIMSSVLEDQFGVIQKKLPEIIMSLINLQQAVERHKGLTTNLSNKSKFDIRDLELKQELRQSLKSSLYKICLAYGDGVTEIDLPVEYKIKLESFKNFME